MPTTAPIPPWLVLLAASVAFGFGVVGAAAEDVRPAPEAATGFAGREVAVATRHMAVTADARASEAARQMLRDGGSAVDAAIAAQLVLGLVEPQSSGLGGGAFLVHFDAASGQIDTYDARETAPASSRPDRFLSEGKRLSFREAVGSGLSVGAPGVIAGMEMAHRAHGLLPWSKLFDPAIKLADDGFAVSHRLNLLLTYQGADSFATSARNYFFDAGGAPRSVGFLLKNPEYAATLRAIAADPRSFYSGPIADAIVGAVRSAASSPGDLSPSDLAAYAAIKRAPLCVIYRGRRLCGMGPPSSGGFAVAQSLKLVEPIAAVAGGPMEPAALHAIVEAEKLAYADRNRYMADPDFAPPPDGLLDDVYIAARRALIGSTASIAAPEAGIPFTLLRRSFGRDATVESVGTSHISILDSRGNAVAMTTTIENAFGSRLWAAGFLLNNQLTDFSFVPVDDQGTAVANRVEAGKRPRSSMAPTIVLGADGKVEAITGSPGGGRIIMYVVKSLVALLDWKLDPQSAAALPNFGSDGSGFQIEFDGRSIWPALALRGLGHDVRVVEMNSGVHTILRRGGKLYGGVDPRREGAALGD